jgi:hypothetical protein
MNYKTRTKLKLNWLKEKHSMNKSEALLKVFTASAVIESKLNKSTKLQLLEYVQNANKYEIMALLLDGKITKVDNYNKDIIVDRFKVSKYPKVIEEKNWIQTAIKKPGQLHKDLGVPKDKKIPTKKLIVAAKKKGKIGQRARLAQKLKKLNK